MDCTQDSGLLKTFDLPRVCSQRDLNPLLMVSYNISHHGFTKMWLGDIDLTVSCVVSYSTYVHTKNFEVA